MPSQQLVNNSKNGKMREGKKSKNIHIEKTTSYTTSKFLSTIDVASIPNNIPSLNLT